MANLTVVNVDPNGAKMPEAQYLDHLAAIGGDDASGNPYERIAAIAADPDQARHAFVELMHRVVGEGGKVEWVQRPMLGERRENSVTKHVITARFRIVE